MTARDVIVEARGLVLSYEDGLRQVCAVDHVDLVVRRGEFVGLVGPSGSGKSSLLFLLAGLRAPQAGSVALCGQPVPRDADRSAPLRRRHVGFLFQEPFLVPYLSVRENALAHVLDDAEAGARLERLAAEIGMEALLDERPHRLSGGERQRAGILRALAAAPEVILADEPTASLDQETGHAVMRLLQAHAREAALVVVTHDRGMLSGADRVLGVRDGALTST